MIHRITIQENVKRNGVYAILFILFIVTVGSYISIKSLYMYKVTVVV